MSSLVNYENRGGVAFLTLNRPDKLNALNDALVSDLAAALRRFDWDDECRVAVLHGAGRAFCSGADLKESQTSSEASASMWSQGRRPRELFHQFVHWKPVVAAIHGYALGAGLGLALRSDALFAARSARMQVTETTRNLPAGGLWALLHFRGGGALADDVALTGRYFTGAEAAARGIATQATEDGQHLAAADDYARRLAALPPDSLRATVRIRRWYMQNAEREAGFLAEPRPLLDMRVATEPTFAKIDDSTGLP